MNPQEENRTAETESRGHSRHHHHSRHRRHSKNKMVKFWKKHSQLIKNITMLILAFALVVALAALADLYSKTPAGNTEPTEPTGQVSVDAAPVMRVEVPYFGEDVFLVSETAWEFINRDPSQPAVEFIERINPEKKRLDVGVPVELTVEVGGMPAGCLVASAVAEVSENPDFSDPAVYTLNPDELRFQIFHLKTGTRYYYRVTYTLTDGTVSALSSSFTTADTPRILSIDGIANVRDIGGWKTTDGKTIRQGLLYRGSELDGAVEPSYCLTETGRHDMLAVLGIRTDMDLRADTDNAYGTHALGANVQHIYYTVTDYVRLFTPYGRNTTRQLFSDLADKECYPVYLHCTYGLDRTGTMCYLLEALLGVGEEDLRRDYELSALYNRYLTVDQFEDFVAEFKKLEGDTMAQKAESFLLECGVTQAQIASIREIFLEDQKTS